jgi:uncharacterized protein YlzI (FlbEa/FlbD family)
MFITLHTIQGNNIEVPLRNICSIEEIYSRICWEYKSTVTLINGEKYYCKDTKYELKEKMNNQENNIGKILKGFCNGHFGRDSYERKAIEAEGTDWIVVRYDTGKVDFTTFNSIEEKQIKINQWANKGEY